jgi:hypothetical protein
MSVDFTSPWLAIVAGIAALVAGCVAWYRHEARIALDDMEPTSTCPESFDSHDDALDWWTTYRRRHAPDHPAVVADLDARRRNDGGVV